VPCRVIFFTFLVTDASAAKFFDALGEARCAAITHVSADAATWIADEVADKCPLHDGLFDSEQGRPYRGAAHAVLRSHRFRTFRQPRT
jgi:hypothetical protein